MTKLGLIMSTNNLGVGNMIDHEEMIFKTLTGKYKHYCVEWDGMAIDEFSPEFEACLCYNVEKEEND
jgi:hypothetical protein